MATGCSPRIPARWLARDLCTSGCENGRRGSYRCDFIRRTAAWKKTSSGSHLSFPTHMLFPPSLRLQPARGGELFRRPQRGAPIDRHAVPAGFSGIFESGPENTHLAEIEHRYVAVALDGLALDL